MTRLSCHRFRSNEVRMGLSVLAYNLGNLWRRLVLPKRIENWSLTSLPQRLVKTGGRLVKHARYYWLLLAEGHTDGSSERGWVGSRCYGRDRERVAASAAESGQGVEGRRGVARMGWNLKISSCAGAGRGPVGDAPDENRFITSRAGEMGVQSPPFSKSKRKSRLYLFTRHTNKETADMEARQFPLRAGFLEDAATGVAAAALGAYLAMYDLKGQPGQHEFRIAQGYAIGAPSQIEAIAECASGSVIRTAIRGMAQVTGSEHVPFALWQAEEQI